MPLTIGDAFGWRKAGREGQCRHLARLRYCVMYGPVSDVKRLSCGVVRHRGHFARDLVHTGPAATGKCAKVSV